VVVMKFGFVLLHRSFPFGVLERSEEKERSSEGDWGQLQYH
jgi:hypothetical protein